MSRDMATTPAEVLEWYWDDRDNAKRQLDHAHIVFACYETESYEGSALVIFVRSGGMFMVESGHCSCNGLDFGEPKLTTPEEILKADSFYVADKERVAAALEIYKGQFNNP